MNEHWKWSLCSTHTCTRGLDVWKLIFIGLFQCCHISEQQFWHYLCLIFCSIQSSYSTFDHVSCLIFVLHRHLSACMWFRLLVLYITYLQAFCAAFNLSSSTAAIPVASWSMQPSVYSKSSQPCHDCRFATNFMFSSNQTPLFPQSEKKTVQFIYRNLTQE